MGSLESNLTAQLVGCVIENRDDGLSIWREEPN